MKGKILDYSVQTNTVIIRTEDQKHYSFLGAVWREWIVPMPGMHVSFELDTQGEVSEVFIDVPTDEPPITPTDHSHTALTKANAYNIRAARHQKNLEKQARYRTFDWVLKCIKHSFDFKGRARRREYWSFMGCYALLGLSLLVCCHVFNLANSLFWGVMLTMLIPALAVSVRRLHDINRTGWLLLINLVPIVGIVMVIFFFTLEEGDTHSNRYGPASK